MIAAWSFRSVIACAAFVLSAGMSVQSAEPPKYEILDTRIVSWKPPLYHGWPTLARRANGELLITFSGGR